MADYTFNMEADPTGEQAAAAAALQAQQALIGPTQGLEVPNYTYDPSNYAANEPATVGGVQLDTSVPVQPSLPEAYQQAFGKPMSDGASAYTGKSHSFEDSAASAPAPAAPAEGEPAIGPQSARLSLPAAMDAVMSGGGGGDPRAAAIHQQNFLNLQGMDRALAERQAGRLDTLAGAQEEHGNQVGVEHAIAGQMVADLEEEGRVKDAEQARQMDAMRKQAQEANADALKASKEVDPHRLLGPAGNRIMFGLAAMLGSFGQAFLKQDRNQVMDTIDTMINRDYAAQKEAVAGKQEYASAMERNIARFRQMGLDEQTARAGVKAGMWAGLANKVEGMTATLKGVESKTAAANMADEIRRRGIQEQAVFEAGAAKAARAGGDNAAKKLKEAQALAIQNEQLRQAQIKTQTDAAKANADGEDEESASDRRLQSQLAEKVAGASQVVKKYDELIDMARRGEVGPYGAQAPGMAVGKEGNRFQTTLRSIEDSLARGYGGPVTESDRAIAKERGLPLRATTEGIIQHLENMKALAQSDAERLTSGQPRKIVSKIERDTPKKQPSQADIAKRLNARESKE